MNNEEVRKLIMLDFDGVIADSLDATCVAMTRALEAHGLGHLASQEAMLEALMWNYFEGLRRAGIPMPASHAIDDAFAEITSTGEVRPYPGIPEAICQLAERHCVLIVTSNRTNIVADFLSLWAIDGVCEVLGGDHDASKVRKIRAASHRYDLAGDTWFVGDTVGDIREGKQAGVRTVAAGWGWHSVELLRKEAPEHIAGAPGDLLSLLL